MDFGEHLYTLLAFLTACFFVPSTIVLYIVVNGTRSCLLKLLNGLFPNLEFIKNVTVRTATDTMRNQGIITVLLTVKGRYDVEDIKERLKEHILDRKEKNGNLAFPHLRTPLTQKYGRYAWVVKDSAYFDVNNHVVVGSNMYRGRLINEANIQECVSEIVAKYLPAELPPWQITIIPSYPPERFYLLIRIHHVLLSEEGLGLGDLLLLGPERPNIFRRLLDEDDENPQDIPLPSSPLTGLFQTPVAIPKLLNNIRDSIKHHWSKLTSAYDPVENPEVFKRKAGIQKCSAILLITVISILKEILNSSKQSDVSLFRKIVNINSIVSTEIEKRQCTPQFMIAGMINSLKPTQIISSSLHFLNSLGYTCVVTVPLIFIYELRTIVSKDQTDGLFRTVTETAVTYFPLIFEAIKEILYVFSVIYTAPKMLLDELVVSHRDPKHELQTISLCGRKVVAWSDPVPLDVVRRIANSVGSSPSEILISASSGALKEYFHNFGLQVPGSILTTARFFPLESLLKISRGVDSHGPPSGRGLLCLALPISQIHDNPREIINEVHRILTEARERQTAIYEASLWQLDGGHITKIFPSLAVRLILNYLSRRYAVALTEVAPEAANESTKHLMWGQEVESIMYWRPPQSNICLSLTLMSYGDSVRLGVMADSMIAPGHAMLATNFQHQISTLAAMAGIPRDRNSFSTTSSSSHNYQPNIPPDSAMSRHGTNTSVSSASDELRQLANSSPELNISSSADTSRSNSPGRDSGARSTRSSIEENIFPFTD